MTEVRTYLLKDDGTIPNNPRFSLVVYPNAFPPAVTSAGIWDLFHGNGWQDTWVNGVFSYHHFHSTAHEVLGCFSGSASIQFGGDGGPTIDISAGAAVVIPAGVGHKNLGASSDFGVVGGYPPGQDADLCDGSRLGDHDALLKQIAMVEKPATDPVAGASGPLMDLWE